MATNWGELLVGQLEFYQGFHLGPRLVGLTAEELPVGARGAQLDGAAGGREIMHHSGGISLLPDLYRARSDG
jgi:hypothetical protein